MSQHCHRINTNPPTKAQNVSKYSLSAFPVSSPSTFQNEPQYSPVSEPALPCRTAVLSFSCLFGISFHILLLLTTLPGEHLSILQCQIQMSPSPLYSLCKHMYPQFRGLTKMHKTSEDGINHDLLNSALPAPIVAMESEPSQLYQIGSYPYCNTAPIFLYWSHSYILTFLQNYTFSEGREGNFCNFERSTS